MWCVDLPEDRVIFMFAGLLPNHDRTHSLSSLLKSRVNILAKAVTLHSTLNLDGTPIVSQTHTHPSHSQTSRLLTSSKSSVSLGVPVPPGAQCIRDV